MNKWFCGLLALISSVSLAGSVMERWTLEMGDTRELHLDPGQSLRLNQKQIVDVETLEAGKTARIIALRSGLVVIRAVDAEGQVQKTLVIEVLQRLAPEKTRLLQQQAWRAYFCREPTVICERDGNRVRGKTASLNWLHSAREQCAKQVPCQFQVELSESARVHWQKVLEGDLRLPKVHLAADGFVEVTIDCEAVKKTEQENLRRMVKERYGAPLQVVCEATHPDSLELHILASTDRSLTAELNNPIEWSILSLPPRAPVEALIQGLSRRGKIKVLAQPSARVIPGAEIVFADGGELLTETVEDGKRGGGWKVFGFQLQARLIAFDKGQARVKIEMNLSRPQGGNRSLDSSKLQTELLLNLEKWNLAGRIEARSEDASETEIPWLSAVPLVGRLFRWQRVSEVQHRVSLFIKVQPVKELDLVEPEPK